MADFGKPGSRLSLPFPPEISTQVGVVGGGSWGLRYVPGAGWQLGPKANLS